jgi:hypothetical protein
VIVHADEDFLGNGVELTILFVVSELDRSLRFYRRFLP